MLCCGIGALAIAAAAFRRQGRSLLGSVVVVAMAIVALSVGTRHLGHHAERARANERSLLAEFAAQPICTGTAEVAPRAVRQSRRYTAFSNPS
jgi:hypothetical protein